MQIRVLLSLKDYTGLNTMVGHNILITGQSIMQSVRRLTQHDLLLIILFHSVVMMCGLCRPLRDLVHVLLIRVSNLT